MHGALPPGHAQRVGRRRARRRRCTREGSSGIEMGKIKNQQKDIMVFSLFLHTMSVVDFILDKYISVLCVED
jgi:hypothetical protein